MAGARGCEGPGSSGSGGAPYAVPAPNPSRAVAVPTAQAKAPGGPVSLSKASLEELREIGMSVTQARRVIRHREAHGGFEPVDDLDVLSGFPPTCSPT